MEKKRERFSQSVRCSIAGRRSGQVRGQHSKGMDAVMVKRPHFCQAIQYKGKVAPCTYRPSHWFLTSTVASIQHLLERTDGRSCAFVQYSTSSISLAGRHRSTPLIDPVCFITKNLSASLSHLGAYWPLRGFCHARHCVAALWTSETGV